MINPFDLIQKVSLKKWIVLLALSLPFAIRGHGADLLSESDLYDGVLQEIRSTLNGPNQLGLLPDNILSIAVSNDRDPVFSMRPLVMAPTNNLSEAIASFQIDRGGFRLVRGGDIIALGPSQVILASSYTGASRTLAILDPSTVFYSNYSNKFHPHLPFWNRTDWGFRIDGGIALNSAPEHEPDILVDHENVVVVPGPEETVFLVRSNHYAGNSVTRYLKIITQNKEALKTEVYTNLPTGDAIHPIRLKDGKWLLLGQKFLTAEDSLPAKVEDARLEQLLAAFEKGDNKTFLPLLEFVTQYPNPNLDGFIRLLNQKKDPAARLQELESIGNSALQGLEKLNSQPVNKPALANATAEQITNTLQFLDEVEQLRSAGNGISASNLRTALSSGFQYFDGWWIHNPYILHTENFQSAIVYSQYLDRKFDRHYGIFRVDDNRHLSLLGKVDLSSSVNYSDIRDASRSPASYQYCRSGTGEEYIFVANEGLGLLTNGKIQWLQSEEFRQMSQLIGSDRHGHLYFGSRPANANLENTVIARNPGHCWVLQPNKPARKAKEVVLLSIGSALLLDSTNRIWFMAGPRPRYAGMPMSTSLSGETSMLRGRALMSNAFIAKFESKALVRDLPDDPFGLVANLCYFSATGLVRVATNLVAGTQLLKGRDGQVIGVASSGNRFDGLIPPASTYGFHTFFLENQTLQFARTLHELALTHFDLVSRLAPPAIPTAPTIHGRFSSQSAICNFQGILWISQYNEVEAYRDGKPMGVSKKLTLLNHVEGLKTLLGPLQTPSGPTMIVAIQKSTGPLFFIATPNGDEMSLKPFGPPEESSDLSSHVLVDSSFFASQTTEDALSQSRRLQNPLWSEPSQTLYFASAFGKAWSANLLGSWKQLLEGNNPALIRNNGDLVIERQYEAAKGFRIVSTGSTKDIRPTWFKSLSVLAELPGGKLICASPQGLVWLRENADSNFQVELEIPLSIGGKINSYLGQIGSKIFFTVLDSQNSLYLGYVTAP